MNGPQETAWGLRSRNTGAFRHEEGCSKDCYWGYPKEVSSRCSLVAGAPMPDHIYAKGSQQEGKEVAVEGDKLAHSHPSLQSSQLGSDMKSKLGKSLEV